LNPGLLAVLIALFTISFHAIKAAMKGLSALSNQLSALGKHPGRFEQPAARG